MAQKSYFILSRYYLVVSSLNPKCRFQIVWRLLSFFPWDNDCYARFLYQLKKIDWVIFFSKCSSPMLWIFSKKHLRRDIKNLPFLRSKLCFIFWIGNYLEVIYPIVLLARIFYKKKVYINLKLHIQFHTSIKTLALVLLLEEKILFYYKTWCFHIFFPSSSEINRVIRSREIRWSPGQIHQ